MKQFKLVAFDLDGTLINTLPDLTLCANCTFDEFDFPHVDPKTVIGWIGNGSPIFMQRAQAWAEEQTGRTLNEEETARFKERFTHYYGTHICTESRLFPNVKETLETLKDRGYPLAIITNKPSPLVQPVLKAFGIDHLFVETLGGYCLPAIKPHPGPMFYLCGKYGLLPKQMLFVGDSRNDILAAHNAGCPVVGLTYGYNYNVPIAESNPDWVFDDFAQLLDILD